EVSQVGRCGPEAFHKNRAQKNRVKVWYSSLSCGRWLLIKEAAGQSPARASAASSTASAASESMNSSTSCGAGAIHTGGKDWRCRGDGPYWRRAAMCLGAL